MRGSSASRTRHLIFLAHLWALAPFLIVWVMNPSVRKQIPEVHFQQLMVFVPMVCVYLSIRTVLAFRPPRKLQWEYVFPPIDIAIISLLIYLGNRDPLSNVALLYLLPLAEAAGTLSVLWAASSAVMVLAGAGAATHGFQTEDSYNTIFRYTLILLLASLVTSLAKAAAVLREQLALASDRNRIALEMHDGVQGHLMTIARQMELAERLAAKDANRTSEIAAQSRDSARLAADELRFLVHRMRAPSLREGFLPALQQFVHNQMSRAGLQYEFEVTGEPYGLEPEVENALFRIAQEALNNVIKHSGGESVKVDICFESTELVLKVKDDGKGMSEACEGHHSGMESMASRASGISGRLDVCSNTTGTCIEVHVPRKAAERRKG